MQLEIEGPVFRKLPELARVICLGMSALDAIYRFPVIPATPVKVLATAFSECGRHPVPHRHRIRFLVDPNGERLICAYTIRRSIPCSSWLPLALVVRYDAALADIPWPAGAVRLFEAADSVGIPTVFDGDVGPPESLLELARHTTHVAFSQPD
jgi:hypothetical protein